MISANVIDQGLREPGRVDTIQADCIKNSTVLYHKLRPSWRRVTGMYVAIKCNALRIR